MQKKKRGAYLTADSLVWTDVSGSPDSEFSDSFLTLNGLKVRELTLGGGRPPNDSVKRHRRRRHRMFSVYCSWLLANDDRELVHIKFV